MSDPHGAASVTITDLNHSYDTVPVLHDINLLIESGESIALLGPSGCGKTTLLRLIAGLSRPQTGEIRIGDALVTSPGTWVPPERRRVGMVFQDWALFPHMNVAANVGYGLSRAERKGTQITDALALVDLVGLGDRMPDTLSGGQQQRVALARALAARPAILLLDEPFSNLDAALRVEVRSEVRRLLHQLEITAVFVTHDQEEAFVLGDRVAVMREGRLVQVDTPQRLYTEPADAAMARFVGSGAIVQTTAADGIATTPCGPIAVTVETGPVEVLLRPEQLAITPGTGATVDLVEYYGHDTMVMVRSADDSLLRVRCSPDIEVARGDTVQLQFIGAQAIAFASNQPQS